ncbi:MAG: hypothetical protein MJZ68_01085 [archaeon]|nr:hypothetical protein [archaeon]
MIAFDEDIREKRAPPIAAANVVIIAAILAIIGIVCLLTQIYIGALVMGGIGLVLGGYAMGFVHRSGGNKVLFGISGAALLLSVFSFMIGFAGAL